jgi:Tol biopolymer transport system component
MRLGPARRIVHDTTWWETHGFSADGGSILTTNTRAGFLSTDIYSIDLASGARQRLTTNLTWDEHAHLSPDGSKIAWIATRWHPAAVSALTTAGISPLYDFLWIVPGISFDFLDPPAGYSSELTLMDADATNVQQLTTDGIVVADNQWSSDGTKIIFRQSDPNAGTTKIRLLTFDDCK